MIRSLVFVPVALVALAVGCRPKPERPEKPVDAAPPVASSTAVAPSVPPLPTAIPPMTWHPSDKVPAGTYTHVEECATPATTTLVVAADGKVTIEAKGGPSELRARGHVEVAEGTARHRIVVDALEPTNTAPLAVGATLTELLMVPGIGLRVASTVGACGTGPADLLRTGRDHRLGFKRETRCPAAGAPSAAPGGCMCPGSSGTTNPCPAGGNYPKVVGSACVHECWEPPK